MREYGNGFVPSRAHASFGLVYNPMVRIAIGSDHAGFHLKETVKAHLLGEGIGVVDMGTTSDAPVDYPDYAEVVARMVASGESDRGILVCGTGIGMAIAANKVRGIRAAAATDLESARMSRSHNDANILALGERTTPSDRALEIVQVFLDTPFAGGRHQRRVDKVSALEQGLGVVRPL
jgi:ribose 5-phosphate isomerase B